MEKCLNQQITQGQISAFELVDELWCEWIYSNSPWISLGDWGCPPYRVLDAAQREAPHWPGQIWYRQAESDAPTEIWGQSHPAEGRKGSTESWHRTSTEQAQNQRLQMNWVYQHLSTDDQVMTVTRATTTTRIMAAMAAMAASLKFFNVLVENFWQGHLGLLFWDRLFVLCASERKPLGLCCQYMFNCSTMLWVL